MYKRSLDVINKSQKKNFKQINGRLKKKYVYNINNTV